MKYYEHYIYLWNFILWNIIITIIIIIIIITYLDKITIAVKKLL